MILVIICNYSGPHSTPRGGDLRQLVHLDEAGKLQPN